MFVNSSYKHKILFKCIERLEREKFDSTMFISPMLSKIKYNVKHSVCLSNCLRASLRVYERKNTINFKLGENKT